MRNRIMTIAASAVLGAMLLAACGPATEEDASEEWATRIPVANAPAEATMAPEVAQATPEVEGEGGTGGEAAAVSFTIVSKDILFEPADLSIPADTEVTISLPNEGMAPHNFAIDALNISIDIAPGETKTVAINAPAGEYEYYCNVPGHKEAGMVGKMKVVKGGAAPAASTDAAPAEEVAPAAEPLVVVSKDILFEPAIMEIAASTDVEVSLPNEGMAPHNFAIDALSISVDMAPGETKSVTINAPAGEYEYYCNVPGHKDAGMVGKLTVK